MIVTQGDEEEEGFTNKKNDCTVVQCAHLQEGDGRHWKKKMYIETNLQSQTKKTSYIEKTQFTNLFNS